MAGRPVGWHPIGGSIEPLLRGPLRNGIRITDQIGKFITSSDASDVLVVPMDKHEIGQTAVGSQVAG